MIGKIKEPSVRAAVPITPGVRPKVVKAAPKEASSFTAVETPLSDGIEATGFGAAAELELLAELEFELLELPEQAAKEKTSAPEAAMAPTVVKMDLRMMIIPLSVACTVTSPSR
ncbi:hypothetical protein GCM10009569_04990 [Arthrobacter russicus]